MNWLKHIGSRLKAIKGIWHGSGALVAVGRNRAMAVHMTGEQLTELVERMGNVMYHALRARDVEHQQFRSKPTKDEVGRCSREFDPR